MDAHRRHLPTRVGCSSAASPKPGFHEKDRLEAHLDALVSSGRMTLSHAQRLMPSTCVSAHHDYVKPR
jgi:hypothetical protein